MFFFEYQRQATKFMNSEEPNERLRISNWGLGVAEEGGEVAGWVKKTVHHKHPRNLSKLKDEIGDVLWYCAALCQELGLQLGDCAAANIKKLDTRYPSGFSTEASIARIDTQEDGE